MSISQRLAGLFGGRIQVTSKQGCGSTFTLTIDPGPLEGTEMLEAGAVAVPAPRKTPSKAPTPIFHGRILLAEDDTSIRQLLCHFLERSGVEVELATNGCVAYEKAIESEAAEKRMI